MDWSVAVEALRAARRPVLLAEPDPGVAGRVALLPGSFDPITVGHAALALAAADRVDAVVLALSVRPVPKDAAEGGPLLDDARRAEHLRRFARAAPRLVVGLCSHGLLVDQVAAARDRFPSAELSLVLGSDKVVQLLQPGWYEDRDAALAGLFAEAGVLYAVRAGEEGALRAALHHPANRRWRDAFEPLDVDPAVAAVSSREVRRRLRRGEDVRALVPAEVAPLLAGAVP